MLQDALMASGSRKPSKTQTTSHENRSIVKKRKCWPVKRQKGMRVKIAAKSSRVLSLSSISWAVRGRGWVDAVKVGAVPLGRIRTPTVQCSPTIHERHAVSLLVPCQKQVWSSKNACHGDLCAANQGAHSALVICKQCPLSGHKLYCSKTRG